MLILKIVRLSEKNCITVMRSLGEIAWGKVAQIIIYVQEKICYGVG